MSGDNMRRMREFTQPPAGRDRARARARDEDDEAPHRAGPLTRLSRAIATTLILVGILYAGLLLVSRTEGFSDIVRGQLAKQFGLEMKVGSASLTPGLTLVLNEVEGHVPKHALKPGVSARRAVIRWRWSGFVGGGSRLRTLSVEDAKVRFSPDGTGVWQPVAFSEVSTWFARQVHLDLDRYTNRFLKTLSTNGEVRAIEVLDLFAEERIEWRGGSVHWQIVTNSEIARVEGVRLNTAHVQLPGRDLTHYQLQIDRAATSQGLKTEAYACEVIGAGTQEVWLAGAPLPVPAYVPPPVPRVPVTTNAVAAPVPPVPAKPVPAPVPAHVEPREDAPLPVPLDGQEGD